MLAFPPQDELNAELEELEQEGLDETLLQVGGTASLPEVPARDLPAVPGNANCLLCSTLHTILQ